MLASEISWTEEPRGLQSAGFKESDTTEHACKQAYTSLKMRSTDSICISLLAIFTNVKFSVIFKQFSSSFSSLLHLKYIGDS